jgi:hypothetical protein
VGGPAIRNEIVDQYFEDNNGQNIHFARFLNPKLNNNIPLMSFQQETNNTFFSCEKESMECGNFVAVSQSLIGSCLERLSWRPGPWQGKAKHSHQGEGLTWIQSIIC